MAGVDWIQGDPQMLVTWPQRATNGFHSRLRKRMEQVLEEAVQDARRFIETDTKTKASAARPGRVDTGDMLNAVMSRVTEPLTDMIVGELGFLDDQQFYYFLQEEGFTHYPDGKHIEGTMALRDAAVIAYQKLLEKQS